MMADELRIQGLDEAIKTLKQLPDRIRKKHLGAAMRLGARIIVNDARKRVPVDTGFIKKNITQKSSSRRVGDRAYRVSVGVNNDIKKSGLQGTSTKNKTGLTGFANAPSYYWRFLEFGTSKMQARPFIRPAGEENKGAVFAKVTSALRSSIAKDALINKK